MCQRILPLLAVALAALPAFPHDYWFEPLSFFPTVGQGVSVHLHVGDHFTNEAERPFQKKPTVRFELISARDKQDLLPLGEDSKAPAARVTLPAAGTYLVAMERAPQFIRLEAEKFNRYLEEEGLESVLAERKRAGEEKKEGRERYSRYLKCLLQSGEKGDDTFRRVLGQKLEIVPQANPLLLKAGDTVTVQVLFEGKPLRGARLFAYHRADGKPRGQTLTTSDDGRATVKLERAGPWLVRLVHMRRCGDGGEADWESYWGALTFGIK